VIISFIAISQSNLENLFRFEHIINRVFRQTVNNKVIGFFLKITE